VLSNLSICLIVNLISVLKWWKLSRKCKWRIQVDVCKLIPMVKVLSLSCVSLSLLFFPNQLRVLSEGYFYLQTHTYAQHRGLNLRMGLQKWNVKYKFWSFSRKHCEAVSRTACSDYDLWIFFQVGMFAEIGPLSCFISHHVSFWMTPLKTREPNWLRLCTVIKMAYKKFHFCPCLEYNL